jgi:hypothetical protein
VTATRLSIHVLATTVDGTASALLSAKRLTAGLDARIVLLVPSRTNLSRPSVSDSAANDSLLDRYQAAAADVGVHVTTVPCVCRRVDDVVRQLTGWSSLVIIGGRRRVWWPTAEQRLVDRLTARGYPVVFAEVGAGPREVAVPALVS